MSIWINMEGEIRIPKNKKVSVKDVIMEHFGDEFTIDIKSENDGPDWYHRIQASICTDGDDFVKKWPSFERELYATSKDITCVLRFL